jgi:hypothetical protein
MALKLRPTGLLSSANCGEAVAYYRPKLIRHWPIPSEGRYQTSDVAHLLHRRKIWKTDFFSIWGTQALSSMARPRSSAVSSVNRIAQLLLVSTSIIGWSGISFAYRPFDSTDAAVADVGQLEVELGPVQFRRSDEERTVIAPAYVLNFGFAKNWELVLEGRGEHPLPPAEDTRSRFVGDALFLKGVLREGALQDKSGPSVAAEFGPLLPGLNDEQGWGASWVGIVSQRWSGGTVHFDLGVALTREHRGDLFVGTIFEGPYDWTVRPVAEVDYEREFNTTETFSVLAGAIWKVSDDRLGSIGTQ